MVRRRVPGMALFSGSPVLRRILWHIRRTAGTIDRRFFVALFEGAFVFVAVAALLVTLIEKPWTTGIDAAVASFGQSLNWSIFTVLGQGDAGYVTTVGGYVVSWLLVLFGVAIVGSIARLRSDHRATLLAISRGAHSFVNPRADFRLEPGDDGLVVAESLGTLAPLRLDRAMPAVT